MASEWNEAGGLLINKSDAPDRLYDCCECCDDCGDEHTEPCEGGCNDAD